MVRDNLKFQTGLRVDGFVFDGFKEVCRRERMLVGEAVTFVLRGEGLVEEGDGGR